MPGRPLTACPAGALAVLVAGAALVGCTTSPPREAPPVDVSADAVRVYAVGDVADCSQGPPMAGRTAALVPVGATVIALGDLAYPRADAATLADCFEPTWGRHRARMLAVAGNHDYVDGDAGEFRRHFGLDALSADARFVAYVRPLSSDWTLIVLDSNVSGAAMQRQREWLARALDAVRPESGPRGAGARCIAVAWHAALHSSGWHKGAGDHMREFWELFDRRGADLVLSGHEHFYEAFAPLDANGDRPRDGSGMRLFTVGTGGARLYGFWRPPYSSRARVLEFGVLELTLAPDRYAWRFVDVDGRVRDAGSAPCRGAPAGPATP